MISKAILTRSAIFTLAAIGFTARADLVTVTSVTGHDGGNWPSTFGHLTDMINGIGPSTGGGDEGVNHGMDTSADPSDPSTWLYKNEHWAQEWKANSRLDSGSSSNAKIGWAALDLGSSTANLENMYLWNVRSQNTTENVATFNVYFADTPAVSLPATPNSRTNIGDYDFGSGGWTLLNGGGPLSLGVNASNNNTPQGTFALGGISAQYIGLEILTAGGTANRVGLAQIEITSAIPEPSTFALLGLGMLVVLRLRKR